jgi:hypothetical protein
MMNVECRMKNDGGAGRVSFSGLRRLMSLLSISILASALSGGGARAAGAADVAYPPEDLVAPGHQIDALKPSAPWANVISKLQAKGDIAAHFTENRFLPFKKIPVVFTGDIRLSRERGLSLHYTSPDDRFMIVDERGVLMRDGAGHSREMPPDPRALAATSALLHVMRFNLPALSEQFSTYATGDAAAWHFAFDPKDETIARSVSRVLVSGRNDQVQRIIMRKSALQRVEILVDSVRENVHFTAEEYAKFFR